MFGKWRRQAQQTTTPPAEPPVAPVPPIEARYSLVELVRQRSIYNGNLHMKALRLSQLKDQLAGPSNTLPTVLRPAIDDLPTASPTPPPASVLDPQLSQQSPASNLPPIYAPGTPPWHLRPE
jgi:hypothetical protein